MSIDLSGFIEKFESTITDVMARNHIPGMSVAIVKEDKIVYTRGFGARNLEKNLPATPHTLWGVASCTKSFTALAMMQLIEHGLINLHDPVSDHIPEINLGRTGYPVTIYHLLTHSSGFPSLCVAEVLLDRLGGIEKWIPMSGWDDFVFHVNSAVESEIALEPGKKFFYNNSWYTLCGEIIERVTQMKYETYVQEKILRPLKMNRSTFLIEQFKKDPDVMTGYWVENKAGNITASPSIPPSHPLMKAGGGLFSSVMDLANYLICTMNDAIFEDKRLVESSLLTQMQQIHIDISHSLFKKFGYGFGWFVAEDFLGQKLLIHGGAARITGGFLGLLPELKLGIVAATNARGIPIPVLLGALAMLMGKDPIKEIPLFNIDQKLNKLAGVYESHRGILCMQVVKKGGLLFLESTEQGMPLNVPLIPVSDTLEDLKFHIFPGPGDKMPVEFSIAQSGKIDLYVGPYCLQKQDG